MNAEEFKKMAVEASKKEYEEIMKEMKKAAESGSFSCEFETLTDGAIYQLREAGYTVNKNQRTVKSPFGIVTNQGSYFRVSLKE